MADDFKKVRIYIVISGGLLIWREVLIVYLTDEEIDIRNEIIIYNLIKISVLLMPVD